MPRILRTNAATEDLVEIFTQAAGSPPLLARRQAAFDRILRRALVGTLLIILDPERRAGRSAS
jgi:hypothetical protein